MGRRDRPRRDRPAAGKPKTGAQAASPSASHALEASKQVVQERNTFQRMP